MESTLFSVAVVLAGCATAQEDGGVTRIEARERIGAIVRDVLVDGKANNPANRY